MRVLEALARRNGQVVSKQELVAEVWSEIAVTDDSLVQCIKDIRRVLEDTKRSIVRTVTGRGYCLHGKTLNEQSPGSRPRLFISRLDTTSDSAEAIEVAERVFERLAITLSSRAGLVVMTEFTRRPDALYEFSGRVSVANGQIRAFILLTKLENGEHIYAEDWNASLDEIDALPTLIADKATNILRIHMIAFGGEGYLNQQNSKLSTQELLSKAAFHMSRFKLSNWTEAREILECAVEKSPDNPVALAMLASMATQMTPQVPFKSIPDDTDTVIELANRAVELGPRVDFVLRTRGNLRLWLLGDHEGCRVDCGRALAINPTFHLTHLTLATSEILSGQPAEGIDRMKKMMSLATTEPQFPLFVSLIALAHTLLSNTVEAFEYAREGHERNPSDSWNALVYAIAAAGRAQITDTDSFRMLLNRIALPFDHFRQMPFADQRHVDMLEERLRSVGFEGCDR
jgi:DNA-binding winged helix-turn-helix (wHTH) protein